jgi:hypothetical protein
MGNRVLACALVVSTVLTTAALVATGPAEAAAPTPGVTVVATNDTQTPYGALAWHDGKLYAHTGVDVISAYAANGSAPATPVSSVTIPEGWHGDTWWQSNRDTFAVASDGTVYVRAPYNGGGTSVPHGWGIGRLAPDGTMTPAAPPTAPDEGDRLGGSSESIALTPDGTGVYLGGSRTRPSGVTLGMLARLPLTSADPQHDAEMVVADDGYGTDDPGYQTHLAPFRADDPFDATYSARIATPGHVSAKGRFVYFSDGDRIERVEPATKRLVTVAGGDYWDTGAADPAEGASAFSAWLQIQVGPVADRAGNLFFVDGGTDRFWGDPGIVWEVRASDGTFHRVAGGGSDTVAENGQDPLELQLHVTDLTLDPDGNLYVVNNATNWDPRQVLRIDGVAAADTAPGTPTAVAAAAGHETLDVTWGAPTDDGGQPVTSYTVRLHPLGAGSDVVRTVPGTSTSFTGLTDGASYEVSVLATNGRGDGPAATVTASPADYQAALAPQSGGTAPYAVTLDASGSRAPAGATYQFFCGDSDTPTSAPSTIATASCTYRRGSPASGWPARVVMRDPASGRTFQATRPVAVADAPDTVEGSTAFPSDNLVVDVPVAADGSLTDPSCGAGSVGATCRTVDGARIVLAAAPGTFAAGSRVRIYRGATDTLQSELGAGVQVQNGFAITWEPKAVLSQPLLVDISPDAGHRNAGAAGGFDLGNFFGGLAQSVGNTANAIAGTVGSAISAAANAVGASLAGLWAAATQNLAKPNNSATNDVAMCSGELTAGPAGYLCGGRLSVFRGVPTERITALDAGSGVVAAGGANVVAAGGGNVVAAGGANLSSTIDAGETFHLDAASVVAAGGLNVVAPGGANLISDNGLGVVASGGANVVAAGGLNLTAIATRDPGFVVLAPADATPPTATATLEPPLPAGGVYPYGTEVKVHLEASAAGDKTLQSVHLDLAGAVTVPHTLVSGAQATAVVDKPGTTTVSYGATDDQLAASAPVSVDVTIAPPAVPGAPTAVHAELGPDRRSLTVSWSSPAGHGDLPLSGYAVSLSDLTTAGPAPGATVDAGTTSTTISGLVTGHRYRATVVAHSDAGDSAASAPSGEVILAEAPQPPSGLAATAGDGSVTLTWTATADDGGLPVSYQVQRGAGIAGPFTTIGTTTSTTYEDAAAANGTTYFYVVKAVNGVGSSAASTPTSASPAHVRAAQAVTFAQPADRAYGAADGPLSATASSGLPVVLTSLSSTVCTVADDTVHVVGAGTCRIEAGQPGDADHQAASPLTRTFTVARAALVVTASNAVMVRKGKRPAIGATYAGFVAGDTVGDLAPAASCAADTKKKATTCSSVGSPDYAVSYRNGKLKLSKTGFAFVSTPVVQGQVGKGTSLKVLLDGGKAATKATIKAKGALPPGVRAVGNRSHSALSFKGVPTSAGTWRVKVTATVRGKVASQLLVFVIA